MGWVLLAGAIAFEVFGTVMLKVSDGFSKWLPSTGVVIGYIVSFVLLAFALQTIGLSTAYAIWAGVGTVGVVLAGVLIFGEHLSVMAIVGIGLIVIGVVLLNLAVPH
jgi:small multidrug resistance pump